MNDVRLLGASRLRELAAQVGVHPTKALGQNFVHDAGTVRKIVRTAQVTAGEVVLEVGPGLGSLTLGLLEAGAEVVAVEIDPLLATQLPDTVAELAPDAARRLTVVTADALGVHELPGPAPMALVANLPYNVAVPVLLTLLERFPSIEHVLVMVQSEVADRLAAGPGSRTYGIPSLKARWYGRTRRAGTVSRAVFWPVPNVDSALVELVRDERPATSATREQVFTVVDAAFAQRRKTLRAALSPLAGSGAAAQQALEAAAVDPAARGEQMTILELARVAEHLDVPGGRWARGAGRDDDPAVEASLDRGRSGVTGASDE